MAFVYDPITAGLWPLLVRLERPGCLDEWRRGTTSRVAGRNGGPDQSPVRESLTSPEAPLLQPGGTSGRVVQLGAAPASVSEEA